jgi:hypothetical protein
MFPLQFADGRTRRSGRFNVSTIPVALTLTSYFIRLNSYFQCGVLPDTE